MRTRWAIAGTLAAVAIGIGGAGALAHAMPPKADRVSEYSAPYCMVDREYAGDGFVTVAGPMYGSVTVPGADRGNLEPVEGDMAEEVALDAEPYGGILYNVRVADVDTPVAVDGIICETT